MSTMAQNHSLETRVPKPLIQALAPSQPINLDHLGPLAASVRAIASVTQAPEAIAMQSVLAAASLSVQNLVNVSTLFGSSPTSLFLLTVGASGERKSSCDGLALAGPKRFEKAKKNAAKQSMDRKVTSSAEFDVIEGPAGLAVDQRAGDGNLYQKVIFGDVTIEGLVKALETNQPSVGFFTDEGGQFFGGHSMKSQNSLGSAARLSKLWDDGAVDMIRVSSDPVDLVGRRLSSHLMVQPNIAKVVFSNATLKDQGFMSRCLPAWPKSNIGRRLIQAVTQDDLTVQQNQLALEAFHNRCVALLETKAATNSQDLRELEPRLLPLSEDAQNVLRSFYNSVELQQRENEVFAGIRGFASKAPEQAARIAAIMTIYDDLHAVEVPKATMDNAVGLMRWYLEEMRRITAGHIVPDEIRLAEELRIWLVGSWREDCISRRAISRFAPKKLRDAGTRNAAINTLVSYGWLVPVSSEVTVDRQRTRTAWHIQERT